MANRNKAIERSFPIHARLGLGGAILTAILLKGWLITRGLVPFNSDEAIVALMARHVLEGELPLFFYGQAYMGSLDALLAALGFAAFGQHVEVIRWVQTGLYGLTLLTTAVLVYGGTGDWRSTVVASWLLAIPAVNVTLYTTASIGNYGETLLLGNLKLITTLRIVKYMVGKDSAQITSDKLAKRRIAASGPIGFLWLVWGSLVGLGLWNFGLSLVYSIPCALYLLYHLLKMAAAGWSAAEGVSGIFNRERLTRIASPLRGTGFALVGMLMGSAPWWYFAVRHGAGSLISELMGEAIAGLGAGSYLESLGVHALSFLLFGTTAILGMRPPWEIRWLAVPLLPLASLFWIGLAAYLLRRLRQGLSRLEPLTILLLGVAMTTVLGFIFTPFGADPSGRYFLPFGVVLAVLGGVWTSHLRKIHGSLAFFAPLVVLAFHLIGTVQLSTRFPPGFTTQFDAVAQIDHRYDNKLIAFLRSNNETRGYTNYWVAYPVAFLSEEQLIFVPHLPYHQDFRYTPRDDRYAPYTDMVARSERAAYITTHHPVLNDLLRQAFAERAITWEEARIGDYHVFYNLSEKVDPREIGPWQP